MPQISEKTKNKIFENIIHYLFAKSPESIYTSKIAEEIARDEEFTKSLLLELAKKKIVVEVKKSPKGEDYKLRRRWRLTEKAYAAYKATQRS